MCYDKNMKKIPYRKSIRTTISRAILLSLVIITVVLGLLSYVFSKARLVSMLADSSKGIAATAASYIKADDVFLVERNIEGIRQRRSGISAPNFLPAYEMATKTESVESESLDDAARKYLTYCDELSAIKRRNAIEGPINVYVKEGKALTLILSSDMAITGARYALRAEAAATLGSGIPHATDIYYDKDGGWISAFAPIIDVSVAGGGRAIAILEVNRNLNAFLQGLRGELWVIIIVCLIGLAGTMLLSRKLVNNLVASILDLSNAAAYLDKENYGIPIDVRSDDEIGYLARTFESLRVSIKMKIDELRKSLIKEKKAHLDSIIALSNAIEIRDPYTRHHLYRVERYAILIARALKLSRGEIEKLRYGCYLHDIGKIGLEPDILKKPQLSKSERAEIQSHAAKGATIVEGIPFLKEIKEIILFHQEHYDGSGYPKGLKGDEIPFLARIVKVADAFDAMTSDRPYRSRIAYREAMKVLEKDSGKEFDPKVTAAFLTYRDSIERIAKKHFAGHT